jgi:hypothetical protein
MMEQEMFPGFSRSDLNSLPNWYAYMATLVNGQTVRPFNLQTLLNPAVYSEAIANRARAWSRKKYTRPRSEVAREIKLSS